MKNIKQVLMLLAAVCALCPSLVAADEVSVQASVESTTVEMGSVLQYNIKVSGVSSLPAVDLPEMDWAQARYIGPSSQFLFVNGKQSSFISHIYNIYPTKVGDFQIPAVTLSINGQNFATEPINIKVLSSGSPSNSAAVLNNAGPAENLQDKIFIVMGLPQQEAYLNERIPLTIKLFINSLAVRNISYPEFEHTGFDLDNLGEPQRFEQVISGMAYQVVEFRTFIYPTRTGELTLGPAKLVCNVLFKQNQQRRFPGGSMGHVFDDEFFQEFDNFFNNYDLRSVTLQSADLKVNVLPLPEEGRPKDFSGAVGKFDFQASASPAGIKVGDPVTLRLRVSGEGNLKTTLLPVLKDQVNFKFYDPQVRDEHNAKVLEQVVIPTTEKAAQIPAVTFVYFDPQEKTYQTITRGPFPLKVTPLDKADTGKVVGLKEAVSVPAAVTEDLGQDIVFIKEAPGRLTRAGSHVYTHPVFWILIAGGGGLWGGLLFSWQRTHRIKNDVKLARRLQAPRFARAGLAQARGCLKQGDNQGFYDVLFKTLQGYLANKFHLPSGTIDLAGLERRLTAISAPPAVLTKIQDVFAECEMVRYASGQFTAERMGQSLRQTEEIIDALEKLR